MLCVLSVPLSNWINVQTNNCHLYLNMLKWVIWHRNRPIAWGLDQVQGFLLCLKCVFGCCFREKTDLNSSYLFKGLCLKKQYPIYFGAFPLWSLWSVFRIQCPSLIQFQFIRAFKMIQVQAVCYSALATSWWYLKSKIHPIYHRMIHYYMLLHNLIQ